jgi:hypothetical protein
MHYWAQHRPYVCLCRIEAVKKWVIVRLVDLEIVALKTVPKSVNKRSIDIKAKKLYTQHPLTP